VKDLKATLDKLLADANDCELIAKLAPILRSVRCSKSRQPIFAPQHATSRLRSRARRKAATDILLHINQRLRFCLCHLFPADNSRQQVPYVQKWTDSVAKAPHNDGIAVRDVILCSVPGTRVPGFPVLWGAAMRSVAEYLARAAEFDALASATSVPALQKRYLDIAECYRFLVYDRQRFIDEGAVRVRRMKRDAPKVRRVTAHTLASPRRDQQQHHVSNDDNAHDDNAH
jgi:hypothetical protein